MAFPKGHGLLTRQGFVPSQEDRGCVDFATFLSCDDGPVFGQLAMLILTPTLESAPDTGTNGLPAAKHFCRCGIL